jgi:Xaa-Pro aminopeptidase
MAFIPTLDYSLFKRRREEVMNFIRQENPELKKGVVILFADFENERSVFRQESSFYYLTGITEPGAVLCLYLDGKQILYLPNYGGVRERWTKVTLTGANHDPEQVKKIGVDKIQYLGQPCGSFTFHPVFTKNAYENFLIDIDNFLQSAMAKKEKVEVFTLLENFGPRYFVQIQLYKMLLEIFPVINSMTRDLAPLVHYLRRFKSEYEIDLIYKAIQITSMAHESAAQIIAPGRIEHEIQAIIESIFTQAGASRPAFPSIVATGKNTTVLHYADRNHELQDGELVVIDIGAEYGYYAADLTRTYPVNGKFSKRQREIYDTVLETQTYIESVAKPGMFLNNIEQPENSLNHLAIKFLEKKGLGKYMAHGIGHFLGLDVHDVNDHVYPLSAGDVFTIEPGIYIHDEKLGIRIEDNYLMTDEGVVCLSYQLPRKAEEIEKMMQDEGFLL